MQNKKLYRSEKDRILGGVAGGMGEYLEVDPLIIRLVWLALILSGGIGIVLYIFAWILIPNQPGNSKKAPDEMREKANAVASEVRKTVGEKEKKDNYTLGFIFGAVLVILGLALFFQNLIGIDIWRSFWPVVLIIIGLFLIFRVKER